MTDVAYTIQKECFTYLHSPVEVIALKNSIIPPNGARSGVYNLKEKLIEKLKF
jgi:pyruvate/2-oxoglutarate/acetoin dehydrogenase E1 component